MQLFNPAPTLLQLELLNTGFIGGDGSTLDTNTIFLDGLCGLNGDLVIGLVTVFKSLQRCQCQGTFIRSVPRCQSYQVVVLEINVKVTDLGS